MTFSRYYSERCNSCKYYFIHHTLIWRDIISVCLYTWCFSYRRPLPVEIIDVSPILENWKLESKSSRVILISWSTKGILTTDPRKAQESSLSKFTLRQAYLVRTLRKITITIPLLEFKAKKQIKRTHYTPCILWKMNFKYRNSRIETNSSSYLKH